MINKLLLLGAAYVAFTMYQKSKAAAPSSTPLLNEPSPEQASTATPLTVDDALSTQSKETLWAPALDTDEDFVGMGRMC